MEIEKIQELAEQMGKYLDLLLVDEDFKPIPAAVISAMVFQRCVVIEELALNTGFFDGRYVKKTLITEKET